MMLVLTRRKSGVIRIGDDISITVVSIQVGEDGERSVRLGIDAPREVPVHREEVYDAIRAEAVKRGA